MSIAIPPGFQGPWCPVMIAKYNHGGQDSEVVCDKNGQVILEPRLLDTRTGDFYIADDMNTEAHIRGKCLAIAIGAPTIYMAGQIIWSLGRMFVDPCRIALRAIKEFADNWQKGYDRHSLANTLKDRILVELPTRMAKNIWHIVSAPIFAFSVLIIAAYGAFMPVAGAPFEARKYVAQIEDMQQEGVSFKHHPGHPAYQGIWNTTASHLAHCFQPRGNVNLEGGLHFIHRWGHTGSHIKA